MIRFKTQKRRRSVTVLTLMFALCAAGIVPATATTAANTSLPVITSVQLNLPGTGQITINSTGFGSGRPTVVMGGTSLAVNDGFTNTRIMANLPAPLPAAGDYLLVVTNTSSRLFGVLTVTVGAAGAQGPKVDRGDKGDTGAKGPQGPAGAAGVSPVGQPEPAGTNCQYRRGNGPVGIDPSGVAVNSAGTRRAYVTNRGSNSVSVIDTAANTVVATISVGIGLAPLGVAVNSAGTRAYVTNGDSNSVSVIDTATNMVIATVAVGGVPTSVAVR